MFDKMKALFDMQKKMEELKRELEAVTFEVESADKSIKITMNGSQEIRDIKIQGNLEGLPNSELETVLKDTCNRAIKRSHDIAAQKMKSVTGLNLPGLTPPF
ncbi:MAG: YbaB/EbfC family nucleoid-associated protein [Patescibacteria group bacterium]